MYDALRFTVIAAPERYMTVRSAVLARLASQGCGIVAESNRWSGPGYRGINVKLNAGGERRFEVQLHTRASFEATKATRGLYEELRLQSTSSLRRAELVGLIDEVFARVPTPPSTLG